MDSKILPNHNLSINGETLLAPVLLEKSQQAVGKEDIGISHWVNFTGEFVRVISHVKGWNSESLLLDKFTCIKLEDWVARTPPMTGWEYLSKETYQLLWDSLAAYVLETYKASGLSEEAYLEKSFSNLTPVGKIVFNLAENKKSTVSPFAFMATYIEDSGEDLGKAKHIPLARILKENTGDKAKLLHLLKPIQAAAKKCSWVARLVKSKEIYRPVAYSSQDAYELLKSIPLLEDSGLMVKVPNWWSPKNSRPKVQGVVESEGKKTSHVGLNRLLSFSVSVTLGDQELSEEELEALLNSNENLVLVKGQWVEVDPEKLQHALMRWRKAEQLAADGIPFDKAMRLLSGIRLGEDEDLVLEDEDSVNWSEVVTGPQLKSLLQSYQTQNQDVSKLLGSRLKAQLRPYQEEGVKWLKFMREMGLGACLADDMGLGKTIQTISFLLLQGSVVGRPETHLLVVPASLLSNWQAEINRFAPEVKLMIAHSFASDDQSVLEGEGRENALLNTDIVITTYGQLLRKQWIQDRDWDLLIIDEAQAIKNAGTKQTKAVKAIQANSRIALTGTPIENRLSDLWSLFDFLNKGLLGASKAFLDATKKMRNDSVDGFSPLNKLVSPYIMRRLKTDKSIIQDLPDKTELKRYCYLSKKQVGMYKSAVEDLKNELKEAEEGIAKKGLVLSYLTRFKQICNHPSQLSGDLEYEGDDSGKVRALKEICEELMSRQERVLIFTQYKEMTQVLHDWMEDIYGQKGLILHGGTTVKKRKEMVEEFQKVDGPPFFILSIKAGGTGLNLTEASQVIHFDRWWNPAVENQATDRAFRIGQKRNVLVHKFICQGTIEERIDAMIEEKKGIADSVVGTDGAEKMLLNMNDEELIDFIQLDLSKAVR